MTPQNHRVTLGINSAATGPASQLRVFPRGYRDPSFTVELIKSLKNHSSRRHVDAQRKSLRGEHDADQFSKKQLFYYLFECGQHSGVMSRVAALKRTQPIEVAQGIKILVSNRTAPCFGDFSNFFCLFAGG